MNKQALRTSAALFLLIALFTTSATAQTWNSAPGAYSATSGTNGWEDKSDELPGMSSGQTVGILLGVAVVGTVTALAVRSHKKRQASRAAKMSKVATSLRTVPTTQPAETRAASASSAAPPVDLIIGLPGFKSGSASTGFKVGFRVAL